MIFLIFIILWNLVCLLIIIIIIVIMDTDNNNNNNNRGDGDYLIIIISIKSLRDIQVALSASVHHLQASYLPFVTRNHIAHIAYEILFPQIIVIHKIDRTFGTASGNTLPHVRDPKEPQLPHQVDQCGRDAKHNPKHGCDHQPQDSQ